AGVPRRSVDQRRARANERRTPVDQRGARDDQRRTPVDQRGARDDERRAPYSRRELTLGIRNSGSWKSRRTRRPIVTSTQNNVIGVIASVQRDHREIKQMIGNVASREGNA